MYTTFICSCKTCQRMCKRLSCIPTQEQARVMVSKYPQRMAIYKDVLAATSYVAPKMENGACTFFASGLCELHDAGDKPLQGTLAIHDTDPKPLRRYMLNLWANPAPDLIATKYVNRMA